jgi:ABC-type antimicrobial peptide transport system permease subunit
VFTSADTVKSPEVILINHLMAEKYWPGQDPVGKTAHLGDGNRVVTVVGVVSDGKYIDLDETPRPLMYRDVEQHYQSAFYLLLRTKGDPRRWFLSASQALQKIDPQLSPQTLTMADWVDLALFVPRVTLVCISAFGLLAFVLAAVGLYGAVFYSVSERKKELGIRVALGAAPRDLWRMILRQTSAVTATGVCLGIVGGVLASMLVRSQLYGILPLEWGVFLVVAFAMGATTVLTAFSAARPWMRADPMESVRHA